jgi:phosphoribosylglycinamide formyltransferase-1
MKIVVLFSGAGTNFDAIASMCDKSHSAIKIVGAVTNKQEAKGIDIARKWGIACEILEHQNFSSREEFDCSLALAVERYHPDIVVLAGFMRILTPYFTHKFRCVNIHPSFLPYFKGANAIKESFAHCDLPAGVTIHWVNEELDGGEIILQEALQRHADEDIVQFEERIHALEHRLYPLALQQLYQKEFS